MQVTVFGNQKGGVGKTTTTLGIADALTTAGARVLVVDLDPQATATWCVGLTPGEQAGIDELLSSPEAGLEAAAVATSWGFDLIPSVSDLAARERSTKPGEEFVLRDLTRDDGPWDHVLVDCPPALGPLTVTGLVAATGVILVTEATYAALQGVADFSDTIDRVRRYNPEVRLQGIIVNRFQRTNEQHHHLAELDDAYGDAVWRPILPQTVAAQAAASAGKPPSQLQRRGATGLVVAYRELAQQIGDS